MQMTRIGKENVSTIAYTLFSRQGLSVKFKIKLYSKDNKNQGDIYYHSEYLLSGDKLFLNLYPRPFIEWSLTNLNNNDKMITYITEVFRSRLIRKLQKIAGAFEAYDDGEFDFIKVDQTGTHIRSDLANPITITIGSQSLIFTPAINETALKVEMRVSSGDITAAVTVKDFLHLYYRLKDINFSILSMELINYLPNAPYGANRLDMRNDSSYPKLDSVELERGSYNKASIMGSLSDIENPSDAVSKPAMSGRMKW